MKLRRILLALYVLIALIDATGKILVRDPHIKDAVAHALSGFGPGFAKRVTAKPANNLDIFRASSRNLARGRDMYAEYPGEFGDRFKYSPTFAVLFSPLAAMPWGLSLVLWSLLNSLLLFYAITKVLPGGQANFALAVVIPEVWRNIQSAQSNCIVAGLIILAFAALRQRHVLRAALLITVGTAIKLFPIAAAIFALPSRHRTRFALALGACLIAAVFLPFVVAPHGTLAMQYASWRAIEMSDAQQQGVSLIELINTFTPTDIPGIVLQLAGGILLVLPLLRFPERWRHREFAIQLLASLLLFTVLFNHQAERPSYIIALTGIALWYASSERSRTDTALFGFAFVMIGIASNFLPSQWVGGAGIMRLRLVMPCLLVWVYLQLRLNGFLRPGEERERSMAGESVSPRLSGTRTLDF